MFKDNDYGFSINFSYLDLDNPYTIAYLKALIKQYPQTAQKLTIEITETEAIQNYDTVHNFISEIKNYGVKISLDDFGTGFSNFSQISKLDLDFVKIDGSIISKVLEDKKIESIFQSIIELAHTMNLKIVAEFVSSKEIFEYLAQFDIDFAQGYFIGKPEPYLQEG